jgi:hypothetical protein
MFQIPPLALLAAPPAGASPTITSLVVLGAVIASGFRKQPIGGWLFFFLWQIAVGSLIVLLYSDWRPYAPRAWNDPARYFAFVLIAAPRHAILAGIAGIGIQLVRTFEWRWVIALRYALVLSSMFAGAAVAIDLLYFPGRTRPDIFTLLTTCSYTVYFFVSGRVRRVFLDQNHDPQPLSAG